MSDYQNISNIIKGKYEKELDSDFINEIEQIFKKCEENKKSIDSFEPKLQFDNSHILENISDFFDKYKTQSQDNNFGNIKSFISRSLCLFKGLKYISELSETNPAKQDIYNYLYNFIKEINPKNILHYEVFFPYLYFLSNLDIIDNEILGINTIKKYNFQEQLIKCLKINNFENNADQWIVNFLVNPLNLIHYLSKEYSSFNNSSQ